MAADLTKRRIEADRVDFLGYKVRCPTDRELFEVLFRVSDGHAR